MLKRFLTLRISMRAVLLLLSAWSLATIAFGWTVNQASIGSPRTGDFGKASLVIANLPNEVRNLLHGHFFAEVAGDGVSSAVKGGFQRLSADATKGPEAGLLIARYSSESDRNVIDLISERTGQLWRRFDPESPVLGYNFHAFGLEKAIAGSRARLHPTHPLLLDDGSLVFTGGEPLVKVSICGQVSVLDSGFFHHSIERDADGNLWAARALDHTSKKGVTWKLSESEIVHFDQTGKILQHTPLYQILADNGLAYMVDGRPYSVDPFHINDIQPVLTSGPFWQKGDVFISLRHLSMVFLYRPTTGAIVWHREGPWLSQHDVNILDDHRITIFDNHVSQGFGPAIVEGTNKLATVDFRTGKVTYDYDAAFARHAIKTVSQGRGQILPGGDLFVEDTDGGRLMRMAPDGTVRWRFIHTKPDGTRMVLGWSRYLDPAQFGNAMRKAREAKCPPAQ
jgi:Arylsulfotransferase (ASST)